MAAVLAAALLLALALLGPWSQNAEQPIAGPDAFPSSIANDSGPGPQQEPQRAALAPEPSSDNRTPDAGVPKLKVRLSQSAQKDRSDNPSDAGSANPANVIAVPKGESSTAELVRFIDEQIRAGWDAAEMQPSPRAEDSEWIRRVYLDVVGHIPPAEVVERFLNDQQPNKRSRLIDRLLEDPAYVRHWTTVWTNLLVGRSSRREVDRRALQKFLRSSFARNRPWNEIVDDLISAEGDPSQEGAANFLVAHLNNEAVPATAITARLFLGIQVQCTQCHDHPFNDWEQDQFWSLNSFFKQTEIARRSKPDAKTGKMSSSLQLVSRPVGGPTVYETRRGLMRATFPKFAGEEIDPAPETNRRRELARLMTQSEDPLIARAFVNRLWGQLFGYGFTRPVDDMGPHNPPTHPDLLDRLSREFVESGYDVKKLIRWICESEPYQLTSRFNASNRDDDPDAGHPPLFSRMYVKSMTAEQLYNSLLIATKAHYAGSGNWSEVERQRQRWLQQFVIDYQTEENDEATSFNGTVSQALSMMNSELMQRALDPAPGTVLHEVLTERTGEVEKIRQLFLAALSREPTDGELAAFRKLLRKRTSSAPRQNRSATIVGGLEDIFWALLNSNEFILVH